MLFFFIACSTIDLRIYGQLKQGSVDITWAEVSMRSKDVPWSEEWLILDDIVQNHTLDTTPTLIAQGIIPTDTYEHTFTDAQSIVQEEALLPDIIEPIACPIRGFGRLDVTITYIVLEEGIFAMDCTR